MRPSHTAFVVSNAREGEKARWREVGAIWPHKNGMGFDLVLVEIRSASRAASFSLSARNGKTVGRRSSNERPRG